jgi:GT2 family glycosyltransferase
MKKVFVIILNWNGWKDTIECLKTVKQLSVVSYQLSVVVVDNGSTDGSAEEIKSFALLGKDHLRGGFQGKVQNFNLRLIENRSNFGFAEGNNVGIRYALEKDADYIMLLNNDTLVEKNLLNELIKVMERDKKIGVVGPKIYFAPGFEFHKEKYKSQERGRVIWYAGGIIDWQNILASHWGVDEVDKGQHDTMKETDYVSGCAMMVKKEVFKKIGLFNPIYFLYWEDLDFCVRAKREGFKLLFVPKAVLWHKNAQLAGGAGSSLQGYYITRNRLLFAQKYASLRAKLALFRESLKLLMTGHPCKRRGVLDFYLGRFGMGSFLDEK